MDKSIRSSHTQQMWTTWGRWGTMLQSMDRVIANNPDDPINPFRIQRRKDYVADMARVGKKAREYEREDIAKYNAHCERQAAMDKPFPTADENGRPEW